MVVSPCRSDMSAHGLAPWAHLADGRLTLVLVRECSTLQYLRFLTSIPRHGAPRLLGLRCTRAPMGAGGLSVTLFCFSGKVTWLLGTSEALRSPFAGVARCYINCMVMPIKACHAYSERHSNAPALLPAQVARTRVPAQLRSAK